jgi:hypothetical protein
MKMDLFGRYAVAYLEFVEVGADLVVEVGEVVRASTEELVQAM